MGKFIIISSCYKPNTAPINRLLSFLAAFDKMGIKTEMVFVYSDTNQSKILTPYTNITIKYLWDKQRINNKFIKYANSFLSVYRFAKSFNQTIIFFALDAHNTYQLSLTLLQKSFMNVQNILLL